MLFNSFSFLALLAAAFFLYYLPPMEKFQKQVLIIASLVFYSASRPELTLVLLLSIAVNTAASRLASGAAGGKKKAYAVGGIALNLLVLIFLKYSAFIARSFLPAGFSAGEFLITIPLPLGISFYTFKGISLVVDAFKDRDASAAEKPAYRHAADSLLYISFFPQVLAGPIERSKDFFSQIAPKKIADIDWEQCMKAVILGYFLKMVVADNLKEQTFWMTYPYFQGFSSLTLASMIYGYSIQMFADFAGYSLIAIGVSALFGYRVKDNFLFPYISKSFSEFWRRWHISLSTFLRDYLYIPLGGSRKGAIRTYANLVMVMFLGGFWHGAGWTYAAWGTLHGVALAVERFMKRKISVPGNAFLGAVRMLAVFTLVSFGWIFFRLNDFNHVLAYLKSIASNAGGVSNPIIIVNICVYSIPVILYHAAYLAEGGRIASWIHRYEYMLYGLLLFCIVTGSGPANQFIYFQF